MAVAVEVPRLSRARTSFFYDPSATPVLTVPPGTRVQFETHDARGEALYHHPRGVLLDLPPAPTGRGNPVTGPLAVEGAEPGDSLVVDIHAIACDDVAWSGAHSTTPVFPLGSGRIPRSRVRLCDVRDGTIHFSDRIQLPVKPMIGCIATAPADEAINCGQPGPFGGNLDHPVVAPGARLHLPVRVPGALLWIGDVHAAQGDGELSGVAVEVGSLVDVTVTLQKSTGITWPWVETADRLMVLTSAPDFVDARREAIEAMLRVLESQLSLEPAEAFALISAIGDLRIGQSCGTLPLTLRLELPRTLNLFPA